MVSDITKVVLGRAAVKNWSTQIRHVGKPLFANLGKLPENRKDKKDAFSLKPAPSFTHSAESLMSQMIIQTHSLVKFGNQQEIHEDPY